MAIKIIFITATDSKEYLQQLGLGLSRLKMGPDRIFYWPNVISRLTASEIAKGAQTERLTEFNEPASATALASFIQNLPSSESEQRCSKFWFCFPVEILQEILTLLNSISDTKITPGQAYLMNTGQPMKTSRIETQ